MSAWLDLGLPLPNAKGYAYTRDAALLRNEFPVALPDQGQRNTAWHKNLSVSWKLTLDELVLAEAYLLQYGYSWFNLELVTDDTGESEDLSMHIVRLTSNYKVEPIGGIAAKLSATLEVKTPPVSCTLATCDSPQEAHCT